MLDNNYLKRQLAVLILVALLPIVGCGGGEDEKDNGKGSQTTPTPAELIDTWTFQSVTVNGSSADLATVMDWVSGAVAARFTIYANNAYSYEEINGSGGQLFSEIGFIIHDGNEIEVIITDLSGNEIESFVITYVLSGNTLTITLIEGSDTLVFTLTN